jgi:hypothetical protein
VLIVVQVAFTELRLIRVLDRIEQLKEAGKWSYRQPKKQRGVGNMSKTQWDYLLDEMVRYPLVILKSCLNVLFEELDAH